ncbi:hypothetical protein [Brevundimonas vesicularis]|uniref:hypothetical protein n=1 Tax=Brevundimonas vesicularis TaxID=41276 RepID=UPI00384D42AE
MTESEACEIVAKYEALVIEAARHRLRHYDVAWALDDHRLRVIGGRLELQTIWLYEEYGELVHEFKPSLIDEGFSSRIGAWIRPADVTPAGDTQ